jgi:hypothetical protein
MVRSTSRRLSGFGLFCLLTVAILWPLAVKARAEEIIFLQDGRTITADKTEVIGDRIRVTKPTEIFDIPRSDVLTTHDVSPPTAPGTGTPPAEVYHDMTQQMNEKVRQDTQQLLKPPRVVPH